MVRGPISGGRLKSRSVFLISVLLSTVYWATVGRGQQAGPPRPGPPAKEAPAASAAKAPREAKAPQGTDPGAKVAQALKDLRAIGVALEAYRIDHGEYPPDHTLFFFEGSKMPEILACLTTPVAYLRSVPSDVFAGPTPRGKYGKPPNAYSYVADVWVGVQSPKYWRRPLGKWNLVSNGPDRVWNLGEYALLGQDCLNGQEAGSDPLIGTWRQGCLYDPTNGAASAGDVVLVGPTRELTALGEKLSRSLRRPAGEAGERNPAALTKSK